MKCRKEMLNHIDEILDTYCDGCFLFKQLKKEKGRRYAHRFCIQNCTVGEQLRKIGKSLETMKKI